MELTDIDMPDASDCNISLMSKNGLQLYPVHAGDSGYGLPYAPVDWPNPGDIWKWKAGKRLKTNGYIKDRYLYLPKHLLKRDDSLKKKYPFASKPSVEQYLRSMFPGADIDAFFGSFSWDMPSQQLSNKKGHKEDPMSAGEAAENIDSGPLGLVGCKAGNIICSSLVEAEDTPSEFMSCNICCCEQDFCRYCCCILCCKIASSAYGGYCYIRCESRMEEGYICGHIAHIDCGIRAYMTGTVGGSIGLDAEYYCRRCDSKTDLVQHVMKLVDICQTINSQDNIEEILTVCSRLLRDSRRASAQQLFHNIQATIVKLKKGAKLEDIWSEGNISLLTAGSSSNNGFSALRYESEEKHMNTKTEEQIAFALKLDCCKESFMLEDEVDQVLLDLRKSQQRLYTLAEERLLAKKNLIESLYKQLEKERSELSRNASHVDSKALLDAVLEREKQIKSELNKFNDMKEVAKGFERTSEQVLKNHFIYTTL